MTAPGTDVVEAPAYAEFLPDNLPTLEQAVEEKVAEARKLAESIEVTNEEEAKKARDLAQEINRQKKAIEAERVSLSKPRKDAAEEVKRRYDAVKAPFEEADKIVRDKLKAWQDAEEEKARERKRKIDEERKRVEEEARAQREAAEEAEREAEDLASGSDDFDDQQVAEELAAEARREAEAAAVTETAIQSLPPDAPPAAPALEGFSTPKQLVAEVVDLAAVPDYLPDGTPLRLVDMTALRKWGLAQEKANGGVLPELPGCKFERKATGTRVGS
jgi:hypothetical protein